MRQLRRSGVRFQSAWNHQRGASESPGRLGRSDCFRGRSQSRVINTTNMLDTRRRFTARKTKGVLAKACRHRPVLSLNNILEQDHRAIKRRVNAQRHFRLFSSARKTLEGYEATHRIRKGQARWLKTGDVEARAQLISKLFGLAI